MPHSNSFCYEFEQYRLDPAQRLLTRAGQSIPLTPKATDILLVLLKHAGQVVAKEKLIEEVWPDTFVEESNVTQNIFTLRRALRDGSSGPKYIETVARRGYRFVATVRKVQGKPTDSEARAPETIANAARSFGLSPILAVMPFLSTTGDTQFQYLAEGIPESIINSFSGLSQLRVISRSTSFRYKNRELDPQSIGQRLGADAILVGKISAHERELSISVELVDVGTGWQLWGEAFAGERENIFDIQDQITRQVSRALKLPLTHEDEKRVARRYTENAVAYQAYLEGRYHWSKYTRVGIEKAIGHFGRAIDLDPNYALAYAGIVDCYLRLATNYLPPEDAVRDEDIEAETTIDHEREEGVGGAVSEKGSDDGKVQERVKLRHEWDWKGAERELRRANELKTDYPAAHQWHAAYRFSRDIFLKSLRDAGDKLADLSSQHTVRIPSQISSLELTTNERAQVFCAVAREQITVGNFAAGKLMLASWLAGGDWPRLDDLSEVLAGDLLFTLGILAGYLSSTGRAKKGQREAESLLNGSIALFQHLGLKSRCAEARIELARCYYREGLFEFASGELRLAFEELGTGQDELRALCLVLNAAVERDAGRLRESLRILQQAAEIEVTGQLVTGRCQLELATTLKDLAIAEARDSYTDEAAGHFQRALYECEAIGNHRLLAAVENNLGLLLMSLGRFQEAEGHLLRSRARFELFEDDVRAAQVDETLARLYLLTNNYELALNRGLSAVSVLESTDEEALVSEALTTKAIISTRLGSYRDAKRTFAEAYKVAERCGDFEGAGRALLMMIEEMCEELHDEERRNVVNQLTKTLSLIRQTPIRTRFHATLVHLRESHQLEIELLDEAEETSRAG